MNKKLVYVGIVLVVAAVIVFIVSNGISANIAQSIGKAFYYQNFSVQSNSFGFAQITVFNSSYPFAVVKMSSKANVYFLNKTAFTTWVSAVSGNTPANGYAKAVSLEHKGAFFIYNNVTNLTVPNGIAGSNTIPAFSTSENTSYQGQFYLVVDNTPGSASASMQVTADTAYLLIPVNSTQSTFSGVSGQFQEEVILGVLFFFFLVVGLALVVWGFFKKPKGEAEMPKPGWTPLKKDEVNPEYVNKLYSHVSGKKRAGKAAKKHKKKA